MFTFANQTDLTALATSACNIKTDHQTGTSTNALHGTIESMIGFVERTIWEQTSLYKHVAITMFRANDGRRRALSAGWEATG